MILPELICLPTSGFARIAFAYITQEQDEATSKEKKKMLLFNHVEMKKMLIFRITFRTP